MYTRPVRATKHSRGPQPVPQFCTLGLLVVVRVVAAMPGRVWIGQSAPLARAVTSLDRTDPQRPNAAYAFRTSSPVMMQASSARDAYLSSISSWVIPSVLAGL